MLDFFLAKKLLFSRQKDGFISLISWFSLVGLLLGVGTLVIVMSVMNGFRDELLSKILGVSGDVVVRSLRTDVFKPPIPAIRGIYPFVSGQALVLGKNRASGVQIRGITAPFFKNNTKARAALVRGDTSSLVVGRRLADRLGLHIGTQLTLVAPHYTNTIFGVLPRITSYKISGIFSFGMYQYDNSLIFMPFAEAQTFLLADRHVYDFAVFLKNPEDAESIAKSIAKRPGVVGAAPWGGANAAFFQALKVERNVMFLILSLIIVVAAFSIVSSQILFVRDHIKNIAILRSMGASRWRILRIFLLAGSFMGAVGTALGCIFGLLIAKNLPKIQAFLEKILHVSLVQPEVYYLSQLPARIDPGEVVWVVLTALCICLLAALYPAIRAGRVDPAEILRHGG